MNQVLAALENSKIKDDKNSRKVLLSLLAKATTQDNKLTFGLYAETKITLKPGQNYITSRKIALKLRLTHQELRTALMKLEYFGLITTEGHHYGTIATINNYQPNNTGDAPDPSPVGARPASPSKGKNKMQKKIDITEARATATLIDAYPTAADTGQVIKAAEAIGYKMTTAKAEEFIANYEATGWISGNGQPIRRWKALLVRWKNNDQSKRRTPANQQQPARTPDKEEYRGSFRTSKS